MAAKSQQTPTKKTIRIPLVGSAQNRETSPDKDQRFVNLFPESNKTPINQSNKIFLVKRAGLEFRAAPSTPALGRGVYAYKGFLYSVFGNKLYRDNTSILTLGTSTGPIGWAESLGATNYLFMCDGINGYVISTNGDIAPVNVTYSAWTASTDYVEGARVIPTVENGFFYEVTTDSGSSAGTEPRWPIGVGGTVTDGGLTWTCLGSYGGFPTPHVPTPIYMDGYIFLAKQNSADIYNSDVEFPLGWSSSNFITAEMFPDEVIGLARQNNQLLASGVTSTEYFYDAGLADGTPLARNAAAVQQFGTCAPYATFQNEKFCIIVGQSASGGRCIWQIDGTTPKRISTEYIEKLIDAEAANILTCTSFGCRVQGHFFFVLTLDLINRTLVYDIEEKMWHEWSSGTDKFVGKCVADAGDGHLIVQHATNGSVYNLRPTQYTDYGNDILCSATTAKLDFDSMHRKVLSDLWILGDTPAASSNISFRWSDDDYQTWSSYHTMDLNKRTVFYRSGQFRRRAYQFTYSDNYPCRLESIEFGLRLGEH